MLDMQVRADAQSVPIPLPGRVIWFAGANGMPCVRDAQGVVHQMPAGPVNAPIESAPMPPALEGNIQPVIDVPIGTGGEGLLSINVGGNCEFFVDLGAGWLSLGRCNMGDFGNQDGCLQLQVLALGGTAILSGTLFFQYSRVWSIAAHKLEVSGQRLRLGTVGGVHGGYQWRGA